MKIVIDIPEEAYIEIINDTIIMSLDTQVSVINAIQDGTPLPKGHGRLIDADSMKRIDAIQRGDFNSIESIRAWIDIMPTVVEADREGQDETDRKEQVD